MQNITFGGYHLPTLARIAKETCHNTDSALAGLVWAISNSDTLPVDVACEFMEAAGFIPFAGYPLTRHSASKERS